MPAAPRAEGAAARAGTKKFETNAHGEPIVSIEPTESVYSFLFFMAPIEELREPGKFTMSKILAWLVVIVALILQAVIIYAVWEVIVMGSAEWQLSVVSAAPVKGACNTGASLCQKLPDGAVTCAPPSVQLSGRWDELDANGDGNWTRAEAEAAKEDIYCKYHVNPVEVFDVFTTFLVNRDNIIWIHPAVRAGQGIPKSYFTYAAGDIIMCGYRNSKMCPNLLQKGFFDAPLKHGTVPRVGTTIQSALEYCNDMLGDGGVCDTTLPSTYAVWKKSSEEQCYGTGYNKFTYKHPVTGKSKSMLAVDYSATEDYRKAERSTLFMVYKASVIMVLLCCVFQDLKEIVPLATFVAIFPSAENLQRQNMEPIETKENPNDDDDVKYIIRGITQIHRVSILAVIAARAVMFLVLLFVGVIFLLRETDYLNLILNGLGLLFIVLLPTDLYHQLLSPYLRSKVEQVAPVEVPLKGFPALNRNPALKDIMWLVFMFIFLVASMYVYTVYTVKPVTEALSCACLSEGHNCREATSFSHDFWDGYWQHEVPSVIADIKQMEEAHGTGGAVALHSKIRSEPARRPATAKHRARQEEAYLNPKESFLGRHGWHHSD